MGQKATNAPLEKRQWLQHWFVQFVIGVLIPIFVLYSNAFYGPGLYLGAAILFCPLIWALWKGKFMFCFGVIVGVAVYLLHAMGAV